MGFKNALTRSAGIFLISSVPVIIAVRFLYQTSPLWAGIALGTGLSLITTLILIPWKKQALENKTKTNELPDVAKIALGGSALRFLCLTLIVIWGFKASLAFGLSGILSFGLVFIIATSFEIVSTLNTFRRAHGSA